MYVQMKSGYDVDMGPAWISRVRFSRPWQTAYFHDRTLQRKQGVDANFVVAPVGLGDRLRSLVTGTRGTFGARALEMFDSWPGRRPLPCQLLPAMH